VSAKKEDQLQNVVETTNGASGQTVLLDGPKKWIWWIRGLFR